MNRSGIKATALVAGACFAAILGAACNPDIEFPPEPSGRIGDGPINDSPRNLMLCLEEAYEFQDLPHYGKLITPDFGFAFSLVSDPHLVSAYKNRWVKQDELESARRLFEGFIDSTGVLVWGARRIKLTFDDVELGADISHPDSSGYYQRVVAGSVEVELTLGPPGEPTTVRARGRQEFYVVRGDAAVLDATQERRSDRWYVRRWDDLTQAGSSPPDTLPPTNISSWGAIKARYR